MFSFDINHIVLNDNGKLLPDKIEKAIDDAMFREECPLLKWKCEEILDENLENTGEGSFSEHNQRLIEFVLDNAKRSEDGRIIMPLTCNTKVKHLLGQNFLLSKQILMSNLRKLRKEDLLLQMVDKAFKEQARSGINEIIPNIEHFIQEHPEACFLAHMPVFKMHRETTKCRNVFLSNLAGHDVNKKITLSNNQCMDAGPCLNSKITTSILQSRFDKYVLIFDLVKAFLSVGLSEEDSNKLCFLWFRDVQNKDFTVVGYRNTKLPFGLKCSPSILMLCLFKILIIEASNDDRKLKALKSQIYSLFYMDNGALTANDKDYLFWAYEQLSGIFEPYQFKVQQLYTNDPNLQNHINSERHENADDVVKVLGMNWSRVTDEIYTNPMRLNPEANTKRLALSSIASNYDVFNVNGPILNRSRLYMHKLQCNTNLGWDSPLTLELIKEWKLICRQVNTSEPIRVKRCVGSRTDPYNLYCFVDSSKSLVGIVIYINNIETNSLSFILAKNRVIGKTLEDKSIPSLELTAIQLGTQMMIDLYKELSVSITINNCFLYTDSLVCVNWLKLFTQKMDKMRNRSVYVMNRLSTICKTCESCPVEIRICPGIENPSDAMTREVSPKQLLKSNLLDGPNFVLDSVETFTESVIVPNQQMKLSNDSDSDLSSTVITESEALNVAIEDSQNKYSGSCDFYRKFSNFRKIINVTSKMLLFINKLKFKLKEREPIKYSHFSVADFSNLEERAFYLIISNEQKINFPDEIKYLSGSHKNGVTIPNLVMQVNLYKDSENLLRVKSKFGRFGKKCHPILLPKSSWLTTKMIEHFHEKLSHAGIYSVINEIRKQFWIPAIFSAVKRSLKQCLKCRRFNGRVLRINQSSYRDFRTNPGKSSL